MPHLKNSHTPPGSDEALHRMMNPSLWNCQGCSLEATVLSEALASTTQSRVEKKSNSDKKIGLEIAVSSISIVVALLLGIYTQPDAVRTSIEIDEIQDKRTAKSSDRVREDNFKVKFRVNFN